MGSLGLVLLVASAVISAAGTFVVRRVATRTGFVDLPEGRKAHGRAVPYGGGIAIFAGVVLPLAAAALTLLWCNAWGRPFWVPVGLYDALAIHIGGALAKLPQFAAVLAGGLVIWVMGLIDDRRKLGAGLKLAVQLAVAIALVLLGVRVTAFLRVEFLGAVLTVGWLVVITNAFNFMDNMDGLSAGVALIIAVIFVVVSLQSGQLFIALALVPLVGALAGFLPFNYAPAGIFMGDAGSLFLGYFLGTLSVLFTFYEESGVSFRPIVLPLVIFAVPLYDAVSVTLIRLREGRSPFSGDRRHLSHRLVELGLSERLAVLAIHLLTLGIGLGAVLLYLVSGRFGETVTLVQTLVLLGALVVIERAIRS